MDGASRFDSDYFRTNYRHYERQNPPRKMAFYRRLVAKYLPDCPRPSVLDLGCAFGRFLSTLDAGWVRYGIDLSEYAVQVASRTVPGVRFAVASCTSVPFNGPFDAIVAFDVIEHVGALDRVAAFVERALAPDGAFIFVVPVYDGMLGPVVRQLDHDPTHVHRESRDFWLEWATSRFDIVDWCGVFRYLIPGGPYVNWPTRRFRRVAPAIAVVARRAARHVSVSVDR